jgi:hypothetical protein
MPLNRPCLPIFDLSPNGTTGASHGRKSMVHAPNEHPKSQRDDRRLLPIYLPREPIRGTNDFGADLGAVLTLVLTLVPSTF